MISFFRKIRQSLLEANTVTRYLGYAIGKIQFEVIERFCPVRDSLLVVSKHMIFTNCAFRYNI